MQVANHLVAVSIREKFVNIFGVVRGAKGMIGTSSIQQYGHLNAGHIVERQANRRGGKDSINPWIKHILGQIYLGD